MTAKVQPYSHSDTPIRVDYTLTQNEVYEAVVEWLVNHRRLPANCSCRVQWDVEWTEQAGVEVEKVFKVDVMLLSEQEPNIERKGCDCEQI